MNLYEDRDFLPMLLKEVEKPFNDKDYIFEIKFDGTRTLLFVEPGNIYIKNRRGNNLTNTYPELHEIMKNVKHKCIFDGEIILTIDGKPSFAKLQERALLKDTFKINYYKENYPVTFVCFDILYEDKDLTSLPLIERKKILSKYKDTDYFVKTLYVEEKGQELYEAAQKNGLEGIIAKDKNSLYHINKRTSDWLKIKNWMEDVYYIGAFNVDTDGSLASISVGTMEGNKLKYIGNVTIGKRNPDLELIKKESTTKSPFKEYKHIEYTFVKPKYKCLISFLEKTKNGSLRQPIYKGIVKE